MSDDHLFDHQDWKKIIFHSKEKKQPVSKISVTKQTPNTSKKLDKQIEEGNLTHKLFPRDFCQKLQRKRLELKLTQRQMAQALNITPNALSDIERGVYPYNSQLNNKIKRIYNI